MLPVEQFKARQGLLDQLNTGAVPPELKPLTDPTYMNSIAALPPDDAASTVLGAGGYFGQSGGGMPSAVREYEYWKNLPDDEQRKYLTVKRANQLVNIGGGAQGILGPQGDVTDVTDPVTIAERDAARKRMERVAIALGDAQGAAQVGLGNLYETTKRTVDTIDALRNHPGLDTGTGLSLVLDPRNLVPGTDAYNFAVLAKQAEGQVFASAYQTLKGGGQITEFESQTIAQGLARLSRAQSKPEYLNALNDLETLLLNIYSRNRQEAEGQFTAPPNPLTQPTTITAGQSGPPAQTPSGRKKRTVEDVIRQYGGQ